jgi:DNA-binding MarR family transcriptional regulator
LLLALEDASSFVDRYELPRRFSQRGLIQLLDMQQSHVSRAVSALLAEGLIDQDRRRVSGERRRVTAYAPTYAGQEFIRTLRKALLAAVVLTPTADGTLNQVTLQSLFQTWERAGWRAPDDTLSINEMLARAAEHDQFKLLDAPAEVEQTADRSDDLSAEAIGLHLELAELRRMQGDLPGALNHLGRAADLHRRRGNTRGEIQCMLAASSLGGRIEDPQRLRSDISTIRDASRRSDALLMLHDVLRKESPAAAHELLLELNAKSQSDPEIMLRQAQFEFAQGNIPDLSALALDSTHPDPLRCSLWKASRTLIQVQVASKQDQDWPVLQEALRALHGIGSDSAYPHADLHAHLTLALLAHPELSEPQQSDILQQSWDLNPPLPVAGHIGFNLATRSDSEQSESILSRLERMFAKVGDSAGVGVCRARLANL